MAQAEQVHFQNASQHASILSTGSGHARIFSTPSQARTRFVPFLPQDNAILRSAESEQALHAINDGLADLLRMNDVSFWASVQGNTSLHECLDSYLRYRR